MSDGQKIGLAVVFMIGVFATGFGFYYKIGPSQRKIRQYQGQTVKFEEELKEKQKEFAIIEEMLNDEARYRELKEAVEHARRRLPRTPEAAGFLQALISVLEATGMHGQSVATLKHNVEVQYEEIPYKIKAYGRYHELGQALTLIEQNPDRFMRVKNFSLKNNPKRPSIHPIDLEVATFMFR